MSDPNALQIGVVNNRAALQLKTWISGRTSPCFLPPRVAQHCRLLAVAPGEWLLVSDTVASDTLREHVRHVHDQGVAAVSGSPGLAAIELEGCAARDVLAKSGGLDLNPKRFPVGSCTRTWLARLPVFIDYLDEKPRFELYVACSYLPYVCSWFRVQADFTDSVQ